MRTLMKVFSNLQSASRARDALLAAGFNEGQVRLDVRDEEAGPVEGNFAIASKDDKREPAVQRGTMLLCVDAEGGEQERTADDILAHAPRGDGEGERLER